MANISLPPKNIFLRLARSPPPLQRAALVDVSSGRRFTLAVDRATGCASFAAGALECLIARRLLVDGFLGNGEPLNEPGLGSGSSSGIVVRGTHVLLLDAATDAPAAAAAAAMDAQLPLQVRGGGRSVFSI